MSHYTWNGSYIKEWSTPSCPIGAGAFQFPTFSPWAKHISFCIMLQNEIQCCFKRKDNIGIVLLFLYSFWFYFCTLRISLFHSFIMERLSTSRLSLSSPAAQLLKRKTESGKLTGKEVPKPSWETDIAFQLHKLANFRAMYHCILRSLLIHCNSLTLHVLYFKIWVTHLFQLQLYILYAM